MKKRMSVAAIAIVAILLGGFITQGLVAKAQEDNNPFGPVQYSRVLPIVTYRAGGWSSSINIGNQASYGNLVRLTYRDQAGETVWTEERVIPGFGAWQTWEGDGHLPAGFMGTAQVEAQYFATVVVHEVGPGGAAMAYNY